MYLPPTSTNLKDSPPASRRMFVALVGAPGSGKTEGALTFPSPFVLDMDGGLIKHIGQDLPNIPIYKHEECERLKLEFRPKDNTFNRIDWIYRWIGTEGPKFEEGQTLIIDSLTSLEDCYNRWYDVEINPRCSKSGEVDKFFFWSNKITVFSRIIAALKGLRCNVVITMHEMREMEDGEITSKIKPVLQSGYAPRLPKEFDEYIRCIARFPSETGNAQQNAKITTDVGPITSPTYLWQIKPNDSFNAKSRCSRKETYIRAGYKELTY